MGRPTNIIIWLVLLIGWTAAGPYLALHPILPAWATSDGYNFPLNLVTTVAELFIGFLIGAASNRSERNLETTLDRIEDVENRLSAELDQNTQLTQQVKADTALLEAIHRRITS